MKHWLQNLGLVGALLGAGFALAWMRFRPYLEHDGHFTDGRASMELADVERLRYAVWDTPEPLAGEVNGPGRETRSTTSPDGRFVVFGSGERGVDADLFVGEVDSERVVAVRPLANANSPFDDVAPRFGVDALYFASNRPGGAGGLDLWRVPFAGGVFGAAEHISGSINSESDDSEPAPRPGTSIAGREELVFASTRNAPRGDVHDLFRALPVRVDGAADWVVTSLDEVNTPQDERDPAFASGGAVLLFASDRGVDSRDSDYDLYRAARLEDGAFAPAEALDALNTSGDERAPDPSTDGFALRFTRDLGTGAREEIFSARSLELFRTPGDPVGWRELLLVGLLLVLALLAWAAKHWRAMDVIYRCFVVSLIVHALLAWWFQRVRPSAQIEALTRDGPRVRVQLTERTSEIAARVARDGELEVARSKASEAAEPTRRESSSAPSALESEIAPSQVAFERAAAPSVVTASESVLVPQAERVFDAGATTAELAPLDLASAASLVRRAATATAFDAAATEPALSSHTPRVGLAELDRTAQAEGLVARELERVASSAARANAANAANAVRPQSRGAELDAATSAAPQLATRSDRTSTPSDIATHTPDLALAPPRAVDGDVAGALPAPSTFERGGGPAALTHAATGASTRAELGANSTVPSALDFAPQTFERARDGDVASALPLLLGASHTPGSSAAHVELTSAIEQPTALRETGAPASGTSKPLADGASPRAFERRSADLVSAPTRASTTRGAATLESVAPAPLELAAAAPPATRDDNTHALPAWEGTPYLSRRGAAKVEALRNFGGTERTEAAVASGLAYLSRIQRIDGSWCDPRDVSSKYGVVGVGRTGLCLLAFLGAGHTPVSGTEYSAVVARAVAWLVEQQLVPSGHFGRSDGYSHGIATYALAETFALTGDMQLRRPLELAVAHVLAMQRTGGGVRSDGGWNYYGPDGPYFDEFARTSITSWQVMALESARLAGLAVPDSAFERAQRFLAGAWDEELGAYRYNHDRSRLNSNWPTLPASTPAAMFALSLLGDDLADRSFDVARNYVLERATDEYRYVSDDRFVERGQGNIYFTYYATLAMFRTGGTAWSEWNRSLQTMLVGAQHTDGSWEPLSSYATEYAGDDRSDAAYSTAMAVLSLEVYYRYFTPLLQVSPSANAGNGTSAPEPSSAR